MSAVNVYIVLQNGLAKRVHSTCVRTCQSVNLVASHICLSNVGMCLTPDSVKRNMLYCLKIEQHSIITLPEVRVSIWLLSKLLDTATVHAAAADMASLKLAMKS